MRKIVWMAALLLAGFALAAQKVTVVSPNGGEHMTLGGNWQITWTATNLNQNVKIQLIRPGGGIAGVIAAGLAPGSSPYSWTVGQTGSGTADPGDYKIRVLTLDASTQDASDQVFSIATAPAIVKVPVHTRTMPVAIQFSRLAVSGIDLVPNAEGFGIVFSYKNAGSGPLPKASAMAVKPNYRVLIDGKEMTSGSLFIPTFAAQPGWEQTGYFGGWIVLPGVDYAIDNNWHIGETITVHINENKVQGMESHSLSLPLKPIALKHSYDLLRTGVSLDWNNRVLTVHLRVDGKLPAGKQLLVGCGRTSADSDYFFSTQPANSGACVVSKKVDFPAHYDKVTFVLTTFIGETDRKQVRDMDFRNNNYVTLKFVRPDPDPVM